MAADARAGAKTTAVERVLELASLMVNLVNGGDVAGSQ